MTTVRSSRASKRTALLVAAMVAALTAAISAHRLDEYLQAARIALEPNGVQLELSLTPGIAVADSVVREIDSDGNGVLSPGEQRSYAQRMLSAIALRIDDTAPLHLDLVASNFPSVAAMRGGDTAITIRSRVVVPFLAAGSHRVFFRNPYVSASSVYLANALVPESDQVAVTGQERDGDQRELTIDFVVRDTAAASSRRWVWIGLVGALVLAVPIVRRRGTTPSTSFVSM
jgi:hypothetical protein